MRQITQNLCEAFMSRSKKTNGNTSTDGVTFYLHGNAIAQWRDDGLYVTHAGWPTVTTKERLNGLNGVSIHQAKGEWYLNGHKWDGSWVKVDGFTGNVSDSDTQKARKLVQQINKYVATIQHPLPMPSGGDCWLCCMKVTAPEKHKGMSWGDIHNDDHFHLLAHIGLDSEDPTMYVHGSLIVNAMREAGYKDEGIGLWLNGMGSIESVHGAVRKYLKKRLIPNNPAR